MVWDNRSHQNANIFSLAPKMRLGTSAENASSHNTGLTSSKECLQELKFLLEVGGVASKYSRCGRSANGSTLSSRPRITEM